MAIGFDSKNEETMKTITTRYGEGGLFKFDDGLRVFPWCLVNEDVGITMTEMTTK